MGTVHLVLLDTAGIQRYIFASNKLRENVGASELAWRSGTWFVLDAVAQICGRKAWLAGDTASDPARIRSTLHDSETNPHIESATSKVEVVLATAGKALLLVKEHATGVEIVKGATLRALKEAPGLDLAGVVGDGFDWETADLGTVTSAINKVHAALEEHRSSLASPQMRFLRLPIVADCATSGLPAACYDNVGHGLEAESGPRSAVALAKRKAVRPATAPARWRHISDLASGTRDIDRLEADWIGIVHADGNGVGQLVRAIDGFVRAGGDSRPRALIDAQRAFALELEEATEKAFANALNGLGKEDTHKVYPLVVGGDDVTVLCDGRLALTFARRFLWEFEQQTAKATAISGLARQVLRVERLTASAGVAIVKPHFPFHAAYDLAEDLLQSAKTVKTLLKHDGAAWPGASALDFHVLYDSTATELETLRKRLTQTPKDGPDIRLFDRPYVVTDLAELPEDTQPWARAHHWTRLQERVEALRSKDEDGRRKLPSSQAHWLRNGLGLGKDKADARLKLIQSRYASVLETLSHDGSLFYDSQDEAEAEAEPGQQTCVTGFLDAMEAAEFWPEEPQQEKPA